MSLTYCTLDESEFPLVKITFHFKNPTTDQFRQFIMEQKRVLAYEKPFVLLMDSRKVGFLSSEIRIEQGNFFKEYKAPLQKYCLGAVIWVSSPLVKLMIKGMMVIAPPPNTTLISSNEAEARKLAETILSNGKIDIDQDQIVTS